MSGESDEDVPQLSASTFAALQQFYDEQEQRETKERQLHQSLLKGDHTSFNEDWVKPSNYPSIIHSNRLILAIEPVLV